MNVLTAYPEIHSFCLLPKYSQGTQHIIYIIKKLYHFHHHDVSTFDIYFLNNFTLLFHKHVEYEVGTISAAKLFRY